MKRLDEVPAALLAKHNSPLPLTLRRARWSDMKALYQACFSERPLAQFGDAFRRSLQEQQAGRRLHLVALLNGEMVGTGQLTKFANLVEIADLAVAETYRGQGIGTALIGVMEEAARYAAYTIIEINVMQHNDKALALYQRLGYAHDRQLKIAAGATVLVLRKLLAA